ncbi:MAG: hypothetical protein JWQ27_2380 [Ferruginibacter sp.]|nr:hypothetical protein [Ferruginibacter sp.]
MKKLLTSLLLIGICSLGYTQSNMVNIKKLLDVTGAGKMGVQMAESVIGSFKQNFPAVPEDYWVNFRKELNSDTIINLVTPVYAKYYTDAEIVALIAFYETPLGKKIIANTPLIMQESMEIGRIWGSQIAEKTIENLKVKGFIKRD